MKDMELPASLPDVSCFIQYSGQSQCPRTVKITEA